MKRMYLVYLLMSTLSFTWTGCSESTSTEEGKANIILKVSNADGETLYLEDVNGNLAIAVDTSVVENGNGHFSIA